MPSRSIKKPKVYKASALKPKDSAIKTASPVSDESAKVAPEIKELIDLATPAVEVIPEPKTTEKTSSSSTKRPKAKLAKKLSPKNISPKKLNTKLIKPLKLRSLRRTAQKTASLATKHTSVSSSKSAPKNLAPQELVDGVKIRIRQPRRGSSKVAEKIIKENTSAIQQSTPIATPKKVKAKKLLRSPKKHTSKRTKRQPSRADLINAESKLGSTIFGPVPAGHRREFFHDQQNIWIWHEGWIDEDGHARQLTVRYEVRPSGVYKKLSAGKYIKLENDELENFRQATHVYLHTIKRELYRRA